MAMIVGRNAKVAISSNGSSWSDIGRVTSASLSLSDDLADATSNDSGGYKESLYADTQGTLDFSFTVEGSNSAHAYAHASGSASSYSNAAGSSSSEGDATNYEGVGASGISTANVNSGLMGNTYTLLTPSEHGYTDEDSDYGTAVAETSWYVYVDDEVEIPSGTSICVLLLQSTCTQAAAGAQATTGAWPAFAETYGDGHCDASAWGSASFP